MAEASLERAIGRLIWVGVRGAEPGDPILEADLDRCVRAHVGGVILFDVDVPERDLRIREGLDEPEARRGALRNIISPEQTRELVMHLRSRLGEGLVVCVDQEGGAVARLNEARGFASCPSARAYAAMDDAARARAAGDLARCVAAAGCDLNLAPCVDVAVNPNGPGHTALGRSFGRRPERVAEMAREQMVAMHRSGVGACLKHFPGHGSAAGDTHHGLVDITGSWICDDELSPFRALMDEADAVMVAHVMHRGLDADHPCSVSPPVIDGLLRRDLGFRGVVLTDSLDMRAIADSFGPGQASVMALQAGADVALEANNLTQLKPCPAMEIHASIARALADGRLTEERVLESAGRIDRMLVRIRGRRRIGAGA